MKIHIIIKRWKNKKELKFQFLLIHHHFKFIKILYFNLVKFKIRYKIFKSKEVLYKLIKKLIKLKIKILLIKKDQFHCQILIIK